MFAKHGHSFATVNNRRFLYAFKNNITSAIGKSRLNHMILRAFLFNVRILEFYLTKNTLKLKIYNVLVVLIVIMKKQRAFYLHGYIRSFFNFNKNFFYNFITRWKHFHNKFTTKQISVCSVSKIFIASYDLFDACISCHSIY